MLSEGKWRRHARSHPWIEKNEVYYIEHPVCPRCERIALRDKGWRKSRIASCPHCFWRGPAKKTVKEYMKERLYR